MGINRKEYDIAIGSGRPGGSNSISDVEGVTVGHRTLSDGPVRTGVTAILPHGGDLFHRKVAASCFVLNGFGKSVGLVQVEELGTLETPILLTNTLSVGVCSTALVRYMLERCPDIGNSTGTVNPVVCECNDGWLGDIRGLHVREEHAFDAIAAASARVAEGSVGAGTGMRSFGLKGGIGSASRLFELDGSDYVVGALVLSNFGSPERLTVAGVPVGGPIARSVAADRAPPVTAGETGSVIVVLATDAPMDARQLGRLCRRAAVGLVRTGSSLGSGSGDIVLAFSTADLIPHYPEGEIRTIRVLHEDLIDRAFAAAAESVEEATISSLLHAAPSAGRDGRSLVSLAGFIGRS